MHLSPFVARIYKGWMCKHACSTCYPNPTIKNRHQGMLYRLLEGADKNCILIKAQCIFGACIPIKRLTRYFHELYYRIVSGMCEPCDTIEVVPHCLIETFVGVTLTGKFSLSSVLQSSKQFVRRVTGCGSVK